MIRNLGSINGRTRFQKLVYLVNLCGWDCFPDYKFHHHGPYSETLVDEIKGMKDNEWLLEEEKPIDNGLVFYKYRASPERQRVLELVIAKYSNHDLAEKTIGLIHQLNEYSSDELEVMASLVFLKRANPDVDGDSLVSQTHELKPRFDEAMIRQQMRIFKTLKPFLAAERLKTTSR